MIAYFVRIWRLRYFWSSLVRTDLRNRYRRSVLGLGWSLMHPILMTAVLSVVFCPLFGTDFREFGPFLLTGLALWNFVVHTTTQGCHCFIQSEPFIRQQPAPLAIYPLRTVLGTGIHGLAALGVALCYTWSINGFGNLPALVSLVPTLCLIFMLGWSLALVGGVVNVVFQDTQHLVEVLFQVLFYLTPVMYPPRLLAERNMLWLVNWNPLAAFLDLVRYPILEARLAPPQSYATAALTVGVMVTVASLLMVRVERRLVFYL